MPGEETNGRPDEQPPAGKPAPGSRNRLRELAFAAVALVLILGLAEGLLRLAGYRFHAGPILTDTTWGSKQLKAMNEELGREVFQPDDVLFWSLVPGTVLRDDRRVNELGLVNGPVAVPKPAGVYRIVCLGDSCTAIGPVAYPVAFERRLNIAKRAERRFEVVNAGVFSYTSYQGLRLLRYRLADVQPDLVTIYYGWNDHYLTEGHPDKLLRSRETRAPALLRLFRRLRLYQLVRDMVNAAQLQGVGESRVRVAPDDYRENLGAMVDLARERGAPVILVTAPSNHALGKVPEYFIQTRKAENGETLIIRHRNYNNIVRKAATQKKTELLDADALFNQHNKDLLFLKDGVHPNSLGRHLLAEALEGRLAEMKVISPEEHNEIAKQFVYDSSDPNRLHSRIEILNAPLQAAAGDAVEIAIRATNVGDTIWLANPKDGYGQVRFGIVVSDLAGKQLFERERGTLGRDVRPGETAETRWTLSPIEQPGRYVLDVCGVAELVGWFSNTGDQRSTTTLIVGPARPEGSGTR